MAASRTLGVEHSTVSRRVGGLEAALGLRLFDRLPRGWRPTPEGAGLVARAEAVEREVIALSRAAAGIDTLTGEVRISAPPVILAHLVAPGLAASTEAHPGLVPVLIGARLPSDLDRAEADIALRLGEISNPDLVIRRIGSVRYGLYGLPDLVGHEAKDRIYLGFDDSLPDLPQARWLNAPADDEGAHIGLRSNDMATLIEAARAGLGLALLPEFAVRNSPGLIELPCDAAFEPRPLHLVMQSDVRRSSRVRILADHVHGIVRDALRLLK